MSRTLLALAAEACERDNTSPAPATLFGEERPQVGRILVTAAADTLRDLLRRTDWAGHSDLTSSWAFTLAPGRFAYPLPPDFLRLIPNTEHLGGNPIRTIGTTPQAWAGWLFGAATDPAPFAWKIQNGALYVLPTPTCAELVTISYISAWPVVSVVRPGDYSFKTSVPTLGAGLVPRDGHLAIAPSFDLVAEGPLAGTWDDTAPGWDQAQWERELHELLGRLAPLSTRKPLPEVRRPAFTADTDRVALTDDHVLSLGLTFRLRRALGLDYDAQRDEYERELEVRASHDGSVNRGFRLGASSAPDVLPLGGGLWSVS